MARRLAEAYRQDDRRDADVQRRVRAAVSVQTTTQGSTPALRPRIAAFETFRRFVVREA